MHTVFHDNNYEFGHLEVMKRLGIQKKVGDTLGNQLMIIITFYSIRLIYQFAYPV